ncbi:porin family protein [uncultured Draconibacterium sp.]|uniref:porin family protein n=1 Tax=uncultured Draconibacterium sp. TaxID=1573823 RepID=UPI0029C68F75|nr:porin family protein [uncultured Draconibacterium sp.]
MKTKFIFIAMVLMLSASLVFAQGTDNSKTAFAILGGVNLQNLNGKDASGDKLKNDMLVGFHVGANVQLPVAPQFYFQPGLLFSTKGAKTSGVTYKLSYVELPLNFVYKALLGNGYFMLGFGPYLAYGIGGEDIEFSKDLGSGNPDRTFKPFDAGGNLFFGYEMAGGLFVQLNTQMGMMNIYPDDTSNSEKTLRNTGYGLSLGYRF